MTTAISKLVDWNTSGVNNIEPTAGHKIQGYTNEETVASAHLNWFLANLGKVDKWLVEQVKRVGYSHAHFFQRTMPVVGSYQAFRANENNVWVGARTDTTTRRMVYSTDGGVTWLAGTAIPVAATSCRLAYGNNVWVMCDGEGKVWTSPDNSSWVPRTTVAPSTSYSCNNLEFGNGLFVATLNFGTTPFIMTSPDGITWTQRTPSGGWGANVGFFVSNGLIYSSTLNLWIVAGGPVVGASLGVWTSATGNTNDWTMRDFPGTTSGPTSIAERNGKLIAPSGDTATATNVFTSSDGVTWTARNSGLSVGAIFESVQINSDGVAVAFTQGINNHIGSSHDDGVTWVRRGGLPHPDISASAIFRGTASILPSGVRNVDVFAGMISGTGRVVFSTDAIVWKVAQVGAATNLNTLVLIGPTGQMLVGQQTTNEVYTTNVPL